MNEQPWRSEPSQHSAPRAEAGGITTVVRLAGVHHLKLPVGDLARSEAWYQRTLGYRRAAEFVEGDVLMGIALIHPAGGPELGIRMDPARAKAAAGFDYFSIGVPDRAAIEALAAWLDSLGESHGGVHRAMRGWILPYLHDPDGHEVRFYTIEEHSSYDDQTLRFDAADVLGAARQVASSRRPASSGRHRAIDETSIAPGAPGPASDGG